MSTAKQNTAGVAVKVKTFMPDSDRIPKHIQLFDKSLKPVWNQWYQSSEFSIDNIKPGTYTLRLSLSSGVQKDETFDLDQGEIKNIEIDIGYNSPHESHEWAYLNKNLTVHSFRDTNMKNIEYYGQEGTIVTGTVWKFVNQQWIPELMPNLVNQPIFGDGLVFEYYTNEQLSVLEITSDKNANLYVSLPPGNKLKCMVKLSESTDAAVHPIDVTVSSDHLKAETLLTLLTNGAIGDAQDLSNAEEAERLLYEKMRNPVTAAIGGYFLLKIGALQRLHDWANNLANWFPWLPDGRIIHATQLLNENNKTENDISRIRQRLLEAANEGIPVYSEGLRLLEKGLTQMWYHFNGEDTEIAKARARIGSYLEVCDGTQETTTYVGISPGEPGRPPFLRNDAGEPSIDLFEESSSSEHNIPFALEAGG